MINKKYMSLLLTPLIYFTFNGFFLGGYLRAEDNQQVSSKTMQENDIVRIKPDGTKFIQDVDGSTIQVESNGTKTIKKSDGTIVQIKPDGTKFIQDVDGSTIQVESDGTKIIKKSDGTLIKIKPDGTKIIENGDSSKID